MISLPRNVPYPVGQGEKGSSFGGKEMAQQCKKPIAGMQELKAVVRLHNMGFNCG
jgi:hypothetical protein